MKKTFKMLLTAMLLIAALAFCVSAAPSVVANIDTAEENYAPVVEDGTAELLSISGSGTATDPFIVVTEEDLMLVSDFPDCHFKLANDIALTSTNWEPLCVLGDPFSGTFDGDGYTISNLTITSSKEENGLFSENAGTIKNLNVETSTTGVYLSTYTGILAGKNSGTIESCNVSGRIYRSSGNMTSVDAGGFVGWNNGTINRCTAIGTVDLSIHISNNASNTYKIFVGGFVGYNTKILTECYSGVDLSIDKDASSGYVAADHATRYDYRFVGGLAGASVKGVISLCFSDGDIKLGGNAKNSYNYWSSGSYSAGYSTTTYESITITGGLVGANSGSVDNSATISTISEIDEYVTIYSGGLSYYNSNVSSINGTITNCYAVTSGEIDYGLSYSNTVTNSFYDKTVSGKTDTAYGTPKSTAAMKMSQTYTTAGWDFENTWAISDDINDGYPYLQWMYETTYKVTYDANGGVGAPDSQRKYEDADLVLSDVVPTREGYKFLGWATEADSNAVEYIAGATYSENAELTLYAVWEKVYYITYNANGGSNAPETQTKEKNVDIALTVATPTQVGYKFLGWATSADAEEVEYLPGAVYSLNSDLDLYAVWEKLYAITYDYTAISTQYKEADVEVSISGVIPTMELREFLGWATSPDSDVVEYNPGDKYSENADLNLYAVWKNLYVDINIGAKTSSTNVRYYEVNGYQYALTETSDNLFRVVPTADMLIEIVEKESADSSATVSTEYYFVDYETLTYSKLGLDSFINNDGNPSIRVSEPKGMRFKSTFSTLAKNEETEFVIEEYGFIVARQSHLDNADAQLNFDFSKYIKGIAYNKNSGIDKIFDNSDDEYVVFSGVLYNIPDTAYEAVLTSKTYTKINVNGEIFTVYGEASNASMYEIAKSLVNSDNLSDEIKAELQKIIEKVEGVPPVDDELDNEIEIEGDDLFD